MDRQWDGMEEGQNGRSVAVVGFPAFLFILLMKNKRRNRISCNLTMSTNVLYLVLVDAK